MSGAPIDDPVADIARAAARRVEGDRAPALAEDVERFLLARDGGAPPDAYIVDPISLGSLIVAVASLAWTIRNDLRKRVARPDPSVIARTLRVRLRADGVADSPTRDSIVEIVVEETTRLEAG